MKIIYIVEAILFGSATMFSVFLLLDVATGFENIALQSKSFSPAFGIEATNLNFMLSILAFVLCLFFLCRSIYKFEYLKKEEA